MLPPLEGKVLANYKTLEAEIKKRNVIESASFLTSLERITP
jgi:hypothetical protein